ncbi:MAG: Fur family transcriptional regulator [Coriobacteriia bacterium]
MDQGNPYGDARVSAARRDIARAVETLGRAFTVEELGVALKRLDTPVALATIYRAVAAMEHTGALARVGEHEGTTLYAACGPQWPCGQAEDHHHHLVCTGCGAVEPVSCPVDDGTVTAAGDLGFVITRHEVRLYGMCRRCLTDPPRDVLHATAEGA